MDFKTRKIHKKRNEFNERTGKSTSTRTKSKQTMEEHSVARLSYNLFLHNKF